MSNQKTIITRKVRSTIIQTQLLRLTKSKTSNLRKKAFGCFCLFKKVHLFALMLILWYNS